MGQWVAGLAPWSYFLTLTWGDVNDGTTYTHRGVSFVEGSWSRWLKAFRPSASWAALESHEFRSTPHLHAVVDGLSAEDTEEHCACAASARRLHSRVWCQTKLAFGRCTIEPVRSALDAAVYVAKYVNKGLGKVYVQGIGADVVPFDPREAELWALAVKNGDLLDRDADDARLLRELHASNVELGQLQEQLRLRLASEHRVTQTPLAFVAERARPERGPSASTFAIEDRDSRRG
jgi:hypothetical protein